MVRLAVSSLVGGSGGRDDLLLTGLAARAQSRSDRDPSRRRSTDGPPQTPYPCALLRSPEQRGSRMWVLRQKSSAARMACRRHSSASATWPNRRQGLAGSRKNQSAQMVSSSRPKG